MDRADSRENDDAGPLDLLVVAAESWILLLSVPLLAAIAVFAIASLDPGSRRSSALLALTPTGAAPLVHDSNIQAAIAATGSDLTTDAVASGLALIDRTDPDVADLTIAQAPALLPGLTLLLRGDTSARTEVVLTLPERYDVQAVLEALLARPTVAGASAQLTALEGEVQQQLADTAEQLAAHRAAIARLERSIESLQATAGADANAPVTALAAHAELLGGVRELTLSQAVLEARLHALPSSVIVAQPSRPTTASQPHPLLKAVLAALAVGLALLVIVFMREGLRRSGGTPAGADKINRIRRAFRLKPAHGDD